MDPAAKSVKRTHLELDGKAPVIVCDDADIAKVVDGLRAVGFHNAGKDRTALRARALSPLEICR